MSGAKTRPDAVAFLRGIAGELAEIDRGSVYSLWRGEAKHRVDQYLSRAEPFFGEWAIDRLVEKIAPEDIVALFTHEVARNAAVYEDVSPVLGIEINEPCERAMVFALCRRRPTS